MRARGLRRKPKHGDEKMSLLHNNPQKIATIKADGRDGRIGLWLVEDDDCTEIRIFGRLEDWTPDSDDEEWLDTETGSYESENDALEAIYSSWGNGGWDLQYTDMEQEK